MSRDIKFRAWDGKRMMDHEYGQHMTLDGRVFECSNGSGCPGEQDYWPGSSYPVPGIVLMQYTGLKDKNGAELYFDCDLCELDEHDGLWYATKDDFGIPCWIPEHGGFGVHIEFSTYFLNGTRRKDAFKIHGNRFENPELLS